MLDRSEIMRKKYLYVTPGKDDFSKELLHYGKITSDAEFETVNGDFERIRTFRYKDKAWYHHMKNGEVLEIFEL